MAMTEKMRRVPVQTYGKRALAVSSGGVLPAVGGPVATTWSPVEELRRSHQCCCVDVVVPCHAVASVSQWQQGVGVSLLCRV
jgi:hypothetical protein